MPGRKGLSYFCFICYKILLEAIQRSRKRLNLKTQQAIKKKRKAFYHKAKKEARKIHTMKMSPKRISKKLGIPNSCPFKEELLHNAMKIRQAAKEEMEEKKQAQKEKKRLGKANNKSKKAKVPDDGLVLPKSYRNQLTI
ncbi:hypothetical protein RFI_22451 [Reticulomyxa filosa]|uniref:Guanine nucleotide-binding protein-like 3 N-terminal domain-containing protein n=1 Tax=Reticulomyxa filosa TaxID=46433 RepID=X6MLQ2_RETFI|nr:hypothetical protein RFI_22451 [Reticulomyxa filosa]|eukprot:ETO14918.1 hypothetical protein RFI_22451 [Reticulomyxa filosa]